jgi:hypothetical protein
MTDRDHLDSFERAELTEQELALVALIGRYVERRDHHQTPCVHDLLAAAAELGDSAVCVLRTVLACYEAMQPHDDSTTSVHP